MTTRSDIILAIEARTIDPGVKIPLIELMAAVGNPRDFAEAVSNLVEERWLLKDGADVALTIDGARQVRVLNASRIKGVEQ